MEINDFDGHVAHDDVQTKTDELARNIIEQIADKWTILVIDALGTHGVMRFSRLRDHIGNVSQKMLTKTLRQLERDGLVSRHVHPVIPPRVDYRLRHLGLGRSAYGGNGHGATPIRLSGKAGLQNGAASARHRRLSAA